jgi:mannitol/fructose-specific phosphotransferase system IIA component (Ntr-type)
MEKFELVSYFNESLFIPALRARTKEGVLEELVERFVEAKFLRNQAIALEMVHRREQLGSTGIGHGIAIPHGRTTAAPEVMIAFGYSKSGIDWQAMDGKPVHLVFMVLAPPQELNNRYLPILGRLVESLSEPHHRDKFHSVTTYSEFINLLKS